MILAVDGTPVTDAQDVVDAVDRASAGEPITFRVRRGKEELDVPVTPERVGGDLRIGITPGVGYDFPFRVSVDIADNIGGPSAGLMMSLAIYDTLTPGSMTGGADIAGTGHDHPRRPGRTDRRIQQKIAPPRRRGRALPRPADNCDGIGNVDTGSIAPGEGHHDARRGRDPRRLVGRPRHRSPDLRGRFVMTRFPDDPRPARGRPGAARGPGAGGRRARDRGARRRERLGPARPAVRPRRHRPRSPPRSRPCRRHGHRRPGRRRVVHPDRAGHPAAGDATLEDTLPTIAWPDSVTGSPRCSSGWCCRRAPTRRSPTTDGGRAVRPRAPDRQEVRMVAGVHPRRRLLLRAAAALARRRAVRGQRHRPGAGCWTCCTRPSTTYPPPIPPPTT